MNKIDLDILVSRNISLKQKWHYFKWPHRKFWEFLYRNKTWINYANRNAKDGCLHGGRWQSWMPGGVDTKDGFITFLGPT
jgi:hypothetical protein